MKIIIDKNILNKILKMVMFILFYLSLVLWRNMFICLSY